jgi:phosphate transport system protein
MKAHIVANYDRELAQLCRLVLTMGERSVQQIMTVMDALLNNDLQSAQIVLNREPELDKLSIETDEEVFTLITRRQPTAIDLRLVMAVSKIASELERAGDKTVYMARAIVDLFTVQMDSLPETIHDQLQAFKISACWMIETALSAFAPPTIEPAIQVFEREQHFYQQARQLRQDLIDSSNQLSTKMLAELLAIEHGLERIGGHGANIAEQVIYIVRGDDVRYRNRELLIDALRHL